MRHRSSINSTIGVQADVNYVALKSKLEQEAVCKARIIDMGIKDYHVFPATVSFYSVLEAIYNKTEIDDIDIAAKVLNYNFRFWNKEAPLISFEASNAIAGTVKVIKTPTPEFSEMGRQKRTENADEYARNMYQTVTALKKQRNISSFRETVKALNDKKIPTPLHGKKWHVNTLQSLQKRWIELELMPAPKPKSKSKLKPQPV